MRALLEGAAPDDQRALRDALLSNGKKTAKELENPDDVLAADWRDGGYPYENLLRRSGYQRQKFRLPCELLKVQA